jgi:hypothetical protein
VRRSPQRAVYAGSDRNFDALARTFTRAAADVSRAPAGAAAVMVVEVAVAGRPRIRGLGGLPLAPETTPCCHAVTTSAEESA